MPCSVHEGHLLLRRAARRPAAGRAPCGQQEEGMLVLLADTDSGTHCGRGRRRWLAMRLVRAVLEARRAAEAGGNSSSSSLRALRIRPRVIGRCRNAGT